MKNNLLLKTAGIYVVVSSLLFSACSYPTVRGENNAEAEKINKDLQNETKENVVKKLPSGKKKIKVALLLDTSGSMDGLIEQAKSQLWRLVNELSLAKDGKEKPEIEIALYEYGNDGLSMAEGYIRQISQFTNDLDAVSEKLFALTTNGGSEFCGQVIQTATKQLDWDANSENLQVMFIAGNEEFTQGPVNYANSCKIARNKDIYINTIYCGNYQQGVQGFWQDGATLGGGNYMSIDQDQKTAYIETPYDKEIAELNDQLNGTYITWGLNGSTCFSNMSRQDANAANYGSSNSTERVITKSSAAYCTSSWDLVDKSKEADFKIEKIEEKDLPKELKGKSKQEKEKYIADKKAEREAITKKVGELGKKRQQYITEKQKTSAKTENSLDVALIKAIRKQAAEKKFTFEDK